MGEALKKTALVADDDEVILSLVVEILEGEGWNVVSASNGQETLELAREVRPEIVIADLRMPRLTGIEVFQALKKENLQIPFLLMTAAKNAAGLADILGSRSILIKPFGVDDLLRMMNQVMKKKEASGQSEAASVNEPSKDI